MGRERERDRDRAVWKCAKWKGATKSAEPNFDQLMSIRMMKEGKPRLRARVWR